MIVSRLEGGIGNQMFQYAVGFSLAKILDKEYLIDITPLSEYSPISVINAKFDKKESLRKYELGCLNPSAKIASKYDLRRVLGVDSFRNVRRFKRFVNTIFRTNLLKENRNIFRDEIEKNRTMDYVVDTVASMSDIYLWGNFQNPDLFIENRKDLLCEFDMKNVESSLSQSRHEVLKSIRKDNSVAVHVRRGDYTNREDIFGVCSVEYYQKAIEKMNSLVNTAKYYIFSDDIEWCRANLNINVKNELIFVSDEDKKTLGYGIDGRISINANSGLEELLLMRNCKHNIIANSSYSWWGAYLNENNNIVVAPKPWFNKSGLVPENIVLKEWITVDRNEPK